MAQMGDDTKVALEAVKFRRQLEKIRHTLDWQIDETNQKIVNVFGQNGLESILNDIMIEEYCEEYGGYDD